MSQQIHVLIHFDGNLSMLFRRDQTLCTYTCSVFSGKNPKDEIVDFSDHLLYTVGIKDIHAYINCLYDHEEEISRAEVCMSDSKNPFKLKRLHHFFNICFLEGEGSKSERCYQLKSLFLMANNTFNYEKFGCSQESKV